MNKKFFTIKFVCDKENEKATLAKFKRDLPIMLLIASKDKTGQDAIYADPLAEENVGKVGYIIRVNSETSFPDRAIIQEHEIVFMRNDIQQEIINLREKYKVKKIRETFDCSCVFQNLESFIDKARTIFQKFGLSQKLWEDYILYIIGDENRTNKFIATPSVKVFAIARIENHKAGYKFEIEMEASEKDVVRQWPAMKSIIKEVSSYKSNRYKPAIGKYRKANEAEKLYPKSDDDYTESGYESKNSSSTSTDTSKQDQIDHVFGESDPFDPDYSKKEDDLRQIKKRLKKFGQ